MARREVPYSYVEASGDYVVHVARGNQVRKFSVSGAALFGVTTLAAVVAAGVIGAAGYMIFRDDMLAGLIERQAQMQYAYEDRLAAVRLRLDQAASRGFVDRDGVEGKVQTLVLRQAKLETRAAVVAQLVERASRDASLLSYAASSPGRADATGSIGARAAARGGPIAPLAPATSDALFAAPPSRGAGFDEIAPAAKPTPEGMDLRFGREPSKKGEGELLPLDTSQAAPRASSSSLANAADPGLPMQARLESLTHSLDRIERDQLARVAGIVRPAVDRADHLKRAFEIAGLPVERYVDKAKPMGGPFIPVRSADGFERELLAAQTAVAQLDGLRRALPTTPLRKPLMGALQMTSTFGYRSDPFLGRPALHSGVDLREEYGTPVRATAGGSISVAGPNGGYGNMVEVDHGNGYATRYAHLSAISVTPGQHVAAGETVGRVGSTGRSTGPHLHYEVRIGGEATDPARFLRAAAALGAEK